MATYDVACIGTGEKAALTDPGPGGFAMNYYHAEAYEQLENCDLVACADIDPDTAATFAEAFDIADDRTYEDYETMLEAVEPDVVSISVWPDIHADVVIDCARAASVDAIHCEKPMALTWGGARRMSQVCWRRDVQLTFNHMRRFKPTWVEARERIEDGAIGDLERIELSLENLYDSGTHAIDFATGVAGDRPAEWVLGQIDYREENRWFGAHNENQALAQWEYDNGVHAVASVGEGSTLVPAKMRFLGGDGVLEVDPDEVDAGNVVRWRQHGDDWQRRTPEEGAWTDPIDDAIAHAIDCLETGAEPTIGARNALNATEIIFAVWESARRRGRVDLPLEIEDNPLHDMVESGALEPAPAADDG